MALVTAPLLSLDASGKVADALVFSKWKGRNYVRALVRPSNPKSGGQTGMRVMFKFLSQNWAALDPSSHTSWDELAEAAAVAPFNSFMQKNLISNRNFLPPTQDYPAAQAETADLVATFTATAGERQITIAMSDDESQQNTWGFLLYRGLTTGFTPAIDNLRAVVLANGGTTVNFVDSPLDADQYFYDAKTFTTDGVASALKGEINATVS